MESHEIDIAKYLVELEQTGNVANNIVRISLSLAEEVKDCLKRKEVLRIKNGQIPILEAIPEKSYASTEILMWGISILSSAWVQWCFTSKTDNPVYQDDISHPEASENVRLALPYVTLSIIDAIKKGKEIGMRKTSNSNTSYRPESGPAWIELRKE